MLSASLSASARRTCPERTRPSNSACAGGSALSWPMRTRLSSGGNGILVPDQGDGVSGQQFSQEGIALLQPLVELGRRIQRGTPRPHQLLLRRRQRRIAMLQRQRVGDQPAVEARKSVV